MLVTDGDKIDPNNLEGPVVAVRRFEETHPWLTFKHPIDQHPLWAHLGEAFSKSQHLAGTPLQPSLAANLARVYLIRGAVSTAAIEGNTLTEEEVSSLLAKESKLPPSQQYLQQEVDNILDALDAIYKRSINGHSLTLSTDWLKEQNRRVLADLEVDDHVEPGEYTTRPLVAGNYKGAPPEDVEYLMDELVAFLNEWLAPLDNDQTPDDLRFYLSFFGAALGHLYIAWIHPFGDGNGRTARLLECAILAHSGVVPWVASNLLSNHYNRTRSRYYQRLQAASRHNDVHGFLCYSAEGFVDMLREQIQDVQRMQRLVAWTNYVHEMMRDEPNGETQRRRRELVLSLPEGVPTKRAELRRVNGFIAEMYAGKGDKTLTRDINRLAEMRLLRREGGGFVPNIKKMDAFLPNPGFAPFGS